jgi:hypothetical protein
VRILSVGRAVAHQSVDNYSVFAAPAFSDFDAVIIDPGGVYLAVEDVVALRAEHRTSSELLVVNGPTTGDAIALSDVLQRRRDELARLLARGGVVVVFAYPQAALTGVLGFAGADRYAFLPAPTGVAWMPPLLQWGEGQSVAVADHAHPFARYIDVVRDDIRYRAVFDEQTPTFSALLGNHAASVFARTGGGAPVGVEFAALGGRIVFLPAPGPWVNVSELGQSVVAAIGDLLATPGDRAPYWLTSQVVPGLAALEESATTARDLVVRAEERAASAEQERDALARVRDILWREGPYGLLPAVLRCCEMIGFRPSGDERAPLLYGGDDDLMMEAEGAREAVGMAPHYRLRARIDAAIAAGRPAPRGLIVVNGHREDSPERRDTQYIDALRVAAEATRYAVVTATDLFAAACLAITAPDASVFAQVRSRLCATDGVVSLADLLGSAPDETPDAADEAEA